MRTRGWPLFLSLSGALACSAKSDAPPERTQPAVEIAVDATAKGPPLDPIWSYFGYDEPSTTVAPEGRELLQTLTALNAAPVFARTHFLFNTGDGAPALKWGSTNVYTEDGEGRPIYEYTLLDGIMDATVGAGARPLFELGFMPQALSTRPEPYRNSTTYTLDGGSFYPPRDYEKWGQLVAAWATHAKERYASAASEWQWELWNEPDLPYWQGTTDEYLRLYDYTEAALHRVLPEAPLGGPAVAGAGSLVLRQFLQHCATGTNAVTGNIGTRLDLVTFHAKGGVVLADGNVRMSLGSQLSQHRAGFAAVARWPQFAGTPIVISEADPEGCAACEGSQSPIYGYRTSPAYGAYVVAMMKRSQELATQKGVNLRGVLTWAFTFPGSPYFAGYRELSTNGIHLPVLNAFKLLGQLRGARVPVTSSGALALSEILEESVHGEPDVDALAAMDDEQLRVLVWNYHDDLVESPPRQVRVTIALPAAFGVHARLTHRRVDDIHGNAFAAWTAQGRPPTPSATQLAELRAAMEPGEVEPARIVDVIAGSVSLSFELPRFGLSLLELSPAP